MSISTDIRRFIHLAELAEQTVYSDASWKTKYEVIFKKIVPEVNDTGYDFNWNDPDTSYEEDAKSYVEALMAKACDLSKVLREWDK